jgi:hypothetical protein
MSKRLRVYVEGLTEEFLSIGYFGIIWPKAA